jgi:hypothetical protein
MSERKLAPILSSTPTHAVCAIAPNIVRVDVDTEDGDIVSALLDVDAALKLSRDLAKAVHQAMRMD